MLMFNKEEQESFLRHIAEAPDDQFRRDVYGDWLEERGQDELARCQRLYTKAKTWLIKFCEQHNPRLKMVNDEEYYYERTISFEYLVEQGTEALRSGDGYFSVGDNMTMQSALFDNKKEFWENVAILASLPIPEGFIEESGFSCAC